MFQRTDSFSYAKFLEQCIKDAKCATTMPHPPSQCDRKEMHRQNREDLVKRARSDGMVEMRLYWMSRPQSDVPHAQILKSTQFIHIHEH